VLKVTDNHGLHGISGTHTPQPYYGPFSGTIRVSQCQKRTSGLYGARGEADTLTIQLGATPSGLTSAHLHGISGKRAFFTDDGQ